MLSSERVLYGTGAAAQNRLVAQAMAGQSERAAPAEGLVLRGAHARPGATARRAVSTHEQGSGSVRERAGGAAGPTSEADEVLRRLHHVAEERGYRAGVARAERQLSASIAAAGAIAAQLEADAPAERAALARWVTDLSLAIARRILGDSIQIDPALMVGAVERAINVAAGSPDVRILLHPHAVAQVRDAWEAAHGAGYLGKRWTFGPDPTLPPTGCLVRYQHGLVDAGLDAQLDAVAEAVTAAIRGDDQIIILEPVP